MSVVRAARELRDALLGHRPARKVAHVYHTLDYAWEPHERFARAYGGDGGSRRALLVGMNPGAWGAAQTGVPFGDAPTVRDWMGITGHVAQPREPHPKRPVLGFAATRRDGSGANLYAWARARHPLARDFFREFYVVNHCPLAFFDAEGGNVTPPQLAAADRGAIFPACDAHLAEVARALEPRFVVGLGAYAEAAARRVVEAEGLPAEVRGVRHPSPANPANNLGWTPDFSFLGEPPGI